MALVELLCKDHQVYASAYTLKWAVDGMARGSERR